MTYFKLRIIILLVMLPVTSWLLFRFFSRLFGVNVASVVGMAFRFDSSVPGLHRAMAIFGFFMYLFLLVGFLTYLESPKLIYDLDRYHEGGLMGYNKEFMNTVVYNPETGSYKDYYLWGSYPTAEKFTETFDTVLIYKSPSREYYQDTSQIGISASIGRLIVIIVSLPVVYICLFLMSESFIKYEGLDVKLDHWTVLQRFRDMTGLPLWKAGVIILCVLLLISLVSIAWISVLRGKYNDLYAAEQQELRGALMEKVRPGDRIRGRVIRRFMSQESEFRTEEVGNRTRSKTEYYTMMHYTVEFSGIIRVPVYLEITLGPGSDESNLLEKAFTGKGVEPETAREYTFTVNSDYSVSLKIQQME